MINFFTTINEVIAINAQKTINNIETVLDNPIVDKYPNPPATPKKIIMKTISPINLHFDSMIFVFIYSCYRHLN